MLVAVVDQHLEDLPSPAPPRTGRDGPLRDLAAIKHPADRPHDPEFGFENGANRGWVEREVAAARVRLGEQRR